jgi:hypothetical protein
MKASVAAAAVPGIIHRGLVGRVTGLISAPAGVVVQVSTAGIVGAACVKGTVEDAPNEQTGGNDVAGPALIPADKPRENGKPLVAVMVIVTFPD